MYRSILPLNCDRNCPASEVLIKIQCSRDLLRSLYQGRCSQRAQCRRHTVRDIPVRFSFPFIPPASRAAKLSSELYILCAYLELFTHSQNRSCFKLAGRVYCCSCLVCVVILCVFVVLCVCVCVHC